MKVMVAQCEEHVGREDNACESPGKTHEYLEKNEGETTDTEEHRSMVGPAMFFAADLGPKLGNATRELSEFMSSTVKMY